jgi:hypothetical protein
VRDKSRFETDQSCPGCDLSGLVVENARSHSANLSGANLQLSRFENAELPNANFTGADLRSARFFYAKLGGANFGPVLDSDLEEQVLQRHWEQGGADLSGAVLLMANLSNAHFVNANLTRADLAGAELIGADLSGANLSRAILRSTNLSGAIFEPRADGLPAATWLSEAFNVEHVHYEKSPTALVTMRGLARDAGLRELERKLTYEIKHTERMKLISSDEIGSRIEGYFNLLVFELTCDYGLSPGRPLWILLMGILLFSPAYVWAISRGHASRSGIWRFELSASGAPEAGRPLSAAKDNPVLNGVYFSLLSAFHIGWRELNLGNWITRLQPLEFLLKPRGWVRTVSGLQSLISVLLLALWALTYFGRPFD